MAILSMTVETMLLECSCGHHWVTSGDNINGECPCCGLPYDINIEYSDYNEE